MASVERELEQQLREAGNKLAELPSSVDELLPLLDQVETFLSRVEQSPPESMQNALAPSLDALIKDELLVHSDFDVKVAVASCISEITRITAPEAPYQDDKMKEVFHLIVSSFENLSDKSSRSFNKMASILETVAKVRSCVVMLDLECDGLIVEMFQHFLKSIRDHHSENVFTSMETIMCLVLEESEEISLELLTPLLASVKNNSEEVKPIARKLGERVFENCAPKLKSYLSDAVKSLGISLDDYSKVVASVCEGRTVVEHNDDNTLEQMADERKLINTSSDEAAQADESKLATSSCEPAQAAKEIVAEDASPEEPEEVELPADRSSPKAIVSNGVTETGNEETLVDPDSSKEPENADADVSLTNKSAAAAAAAAAAADSDPGKSTKPKPKQEQSAKRKGKKTSSVNSVEPSDPSGAGSEKEAENPPVRSKNRSTVVPPAESNEPSDIETEATVGIELSPKKTLETEAVNAASPSPSGTFSSESRQKKGPRTKKKEVVIEEEEEKPPSVDESSKKEEAEVASGSQAKRKRQTAKKSSSAPKNDKILAGVGTSKKEGETTNDLESPKPLKQSGKKGESSDSEAKPLKQSGKKGDSSNNNVEEKSSLRKKDRKGQGRGRGKDTTAEDLTTSLAKDDVKETVSSPKSTEKSAKDEDSIDETPKTDAKRKRSTPGTGKNKGSTTKELAENLVGLKVKVYWPEDKKYYKGVIESYDPAAKKHKVSYDDGDTEVLLLKDEKWDVIEEDHVPNEEKETEDPSPDASPEMQKKKKAKTNPESSAKQEKTPVSPKRSGAASSGKAKGTAAKSGGGRNNKSKVDSKVTSSSKPSGKSEENSGNKSQENSKKNSSNKGGFDDTLRSAMKPKSKQETPKTVTKSKGKTPKSGGSESNANGSGKAKSSLAKGKETNEDSKGKTAVSAKTPESAKGKATESASKSGKKRKKRS